MKCEDLVTIKSVVGYSRSVPGVSDWVIIIQCQKVHKNTNYTLEGLKWAKNRKIF